MTLMCGFALSDEDLRRVVKIMIVVPGVDTPQQAISWALHHADTTEGQDDQQRPLPPPPPPAPVPPIKVIDLMPDTHSRIQVASDFKMTFPDRSTWKLDGNMLLIDVDRLSAFADPGEEQSRITSMITDLSKLGR